MTDPTTAFGWMMYGTGVSVALLAAYAGLTAFFRAEARREAEEEAMPDSSLWRPRF